jgi:hypothetical protein
MTVLAPQDLARIRQAFLLGLARQALPVPDSLAAVANSPTPMLTVLALAGQQQRFAPIARDIAPDPVPEAARRMHADARTIMPEAARRALFRLTSGLDKHESRGIVCAALRRAVRAGFRLHPFDLPRLIAVIKDDATCLGLAERAYLTLIGSGEAPDAQLEADITPENWTGFPRDLRAAFLRDLRGRDPVAARTLLEATFKGEPAAMRVHLLGVMDTGLSIDDLSFLESLAADRAENVRNLAAALVARVPGTRTNDQRLAEAARCFERNTGILTRIGLGSAVRFKAPGDSLAQQLKLLAQLFEGFSVAEVAAAAGLSVDDVIGAIPADDHVVLSAFTTRAARDQDEAMLLALAAAELAAMSEPLSVAPLLVRLAFLLQGQIPAHFAETLFAAPAFQTALQGFAEPENARHNGMLHWTAAVLPESLFPKFLSLIDPLPPAVTRTARDFVEFVRALAAQPR